MTDRPTSEEIAPCRHERVSGPPMSGICADCGHDVMQLEVEACLADSTEDLGECELCAKPLRLGQFVNQYDDIGTAHANCEAPFAKPAEETLAPGDDGSTMPTFVLLGQPALLESLSPSPTSEEIEKLVERATFVAGRLCDWSQEGEPPVPLMQEAASVLRALSPSLATDVGELRSALEEFVAAAREEAGSEHGLSFALATAYQRARAALSGRDR